MAKYVHVRLENFTYCKVFRHTCMNKAHATTCTNRHRASSRHIPRFLGRAEYIAAIPTETQVIWILHMSEFSSYLQTLHEHTNHGHGYGRLQTVFLQLTCSLVVLPSPTRPMWNPAKPTTGMNTSIATNNRKNLVTESRNTLNTHAHKVTQHVKIYTVESLSNTVRCIHFNHALRTATGVHYTY